MCQIPICYWTWHWPKLLKYSPTLVNKRAFITFHSVKDKDCSCTTFFSRTLALALALWALALPLPLRHRTAWRKCFYSRCTYTYTKYGSNGSNDEAEAISYFLPVLRRNNLWWISRAAFCYKPPPLVVRQRDMYQYEHCAWDFSTKVYRITSTWLVFIWWMKTLKTHCVKKVFVLV